MFRAAPVRVRVPATSANLGPGFDAFGLAVGLHDDVVVRVSDDGLSVDVAGEGADDVPRDASHLVVRAMHAAFDAMGGRPRGLELVCANRIPHGRGLGSSAAAVVAGIEAARALVVGSGDRLGIDDVLRLATAFEGHPDNVAACLLGGFTIAWSDEGGPYARTLTPHPSLVAVAFVPATALATSKARGLLPATVPHADAAFNSGRAGLFVHALTVDPSLLMPATEDRLHQEYRREAMPGSAALIDDLRSAGIAAFVSGAGPTVLAIVDRADATDVAQRGGDDAEASVLELQSQGVHQVPLA